MIRKFTLPEQGIEVEIGKYARQADGAAWIKKDNTIVLSTVVAAKEAKEFQGFFPLTVEYRERTASAGKIPGGYIKREGKLSDSEVLVSRLIDRPIRPLFPSNYFNEVQILSTVFSTDGKFPNDVLAILSSSLALTISRIPFMGPIGAIQASRIDGKWEFNISHQLRHKADSDVMITGTIHGISMIEGNCNNVLEAELIDLMFRAHEEIKKQIVWQIEIAKELGVVKDTVSEVIDWQDWKKKVKAIFPADLNEKFSAMSKSERSEKMDAFKKSVFVHFTPDLKAGIITAPMLNYVFDSFLKEIVPNFMAQSKIRVDGRKFDEIRNISVEVGNLPEAHGSCLFTRGETQALASMTLGTGQDAQKVESLTGGMTERSFMLHYNFPPFATGEVKPIRGASRRDIGHGYLAETSFLNVLPSQEKFPYVVRVVSDILESNGSSSMATVCATTMALMDAGVPITEMVSGIAMGLIRDSSGNFHILTDILGSEDALGLMDFKVTGTDKGIMAFQLDIKDPVGLPRELIEKALEQARVARLFILGEMKKVLTAPRPQLHESAPRVMSFKVPQDKIGAIIGPSGKNIREIIAQTGTEIDIEDDGTVKVYARDNSSSARARDWIMTLVGDIQVGAVYEGTVKRIAEFGLFVELVPGREGLIHVSMISKNIQRELDKYVKVNDKLTVTVTGYERETGRIRLVAPKLEK
jgi:polyribonucleotide nucleotidyltransferase